ncbi:uncharacterized protein F4817DRAFT_316023 [Daldinia loculata]|uniref:uncharacterized protein n=1 Tax=Daldinia loculata TaxID=103429 RepID=UPI0020C2F827|nr:uncharacterized protein F4817DRAFT_316023 [Daldinia loculata]KAI1647240.1 hypothetical protein F4817DRAFT_316023 [Daldinia loculata]
MASQRSIANGIGGSTRQQQDHEAFLEISESSQSPTTSNRPKQSRTASRPAAKPRAIWSKKDTVVYMEHLAALTDKDIFDIDNPQTWKFAWPRLLKAMNRTSPNKLWTVDLMRSKCKTERKRYLSYLGLIDDYKSSDFAAAYDQQWESSLRENPTGKSLRIRSFSNEDLYSQVFLHDTSTGEYIREAGELDDLPDLCGFKGNRKPARSSQRGLDTQGFEEAFVRGALEMGRAQGSSDIEKAIAYLQDNLANELSEDQFFSACEKLVEPLKAVAFNTLQSKEHKLRYLGVIT